MKKEIIIAAIFIIFAFLLGYFAGNLLPLSGFTKTATSNSQVQPSAAIPQNQGRLTVTVKNTDNEPLVGIEIDVAKQPGPPESWGVKEADATGSVVYDLEPGTYYVFFNLNRFPGGYAVQPEKMVTITAGQPASVSFVLAKN